MSDLRSDIEKQLHERIVLVMNAVGAGLVRKTDFTTAMSHLRAMKVLLDNRKYGCASGLHASECACDAGIKKCLRTVKKEAA